MDAEHRAANGIFFRLVGEGEPLLLLHGLMASGAMFDPLLPFLQNGFRMIIPDLRGQGRSGGQPGPYDVPGLAAGLDAVIGQAGFMRCAVLGYSHGGAVAQQLAHASPARVSRLVLACTYACNVATLRERMEAEVFSALLAVFTPRALARVIVRPSKPRPEAKPTGAVGMTAGQADWLRAIMAANRRGPMRAAVRGLVTFDSRPWLKEVNCPTLVVGGSDDAAVPRHHFDMLVNGIPGASGRLVERAGHTLLFTHAQELAAIVRAFLRS